MALHTLKTDQQYYEAITAGLKTFELRKNDRGFMAGDVLALAELTQDKKELTGRVSRYKVTYVLHGPGFGLQAGYVAMAIQPEKLKSKI